MREANTETVAVGCFITAVVVFAFYAIVPLIAMVAWNLLVPPLFHGPAVSYWQSVAAFVLAGIATLILRGLFGGK